MAISRKSERSLLSHGEYEDLAQAHLPALAALDDAALAALQRQVRDLRAKERTLVREIRRGISGRKPPRGSSFPGSEERPSQRKQLFSSALKRINSEVGRRESRAAKLATRTALEQALDRKKRRGRTFPDPGRTAREGMSRINNSKTSPPLERAEIGRASQANKDAQAKRDRR